MKKIFFLIGALTLALMLLAAPTAPAAQAADPTPTPITAPAPKVYALVNVPDRGILNIRADAGVQYARVGAFGPQQKNIQLTGRTSAGTFPRVWFEVKRSGNRYGWIGGYYVTEYVAPDVFCRDEAAKKLIDDFAKAAAAKDGDKLAPMVSPLHGMTVRLFRTGTAITYLKFVPNLFLSDYIVDWGHAPGSNPKVVAPFPDAFAARLQDVFGGTYEMSCNDASVTGVTIPPAWPAEYATINYYAVYKPLAAGAKVSERTWLVGVDYWDGAPHIFAIINFGK